MYTARDYDYLLTILKTPMGYLTSNGFTQDINSDEIIVLRGYTYGQYSSTITRMQFFIEKATLSEKNKKELHKYVEECEVIAYRCEQATECQTCQYCKEECKFWNMSREKLKLFKLYYF